MARGAPASKRAPERRSEALLPDVLAFMQVLWALVHRLDETSKRMGRDLGVTGPQRLALRIVGLFPGVSAGDVSAILHVHPSTLTGVLQRLAAQKLVARRRDPEDRRRAVLRLTAKGRQMNAADGGTVEAAVARTLEGTSHGDVSIAIRLLERLADHLDGQSVASPTALAGRRKGVNGRRAGGRAARHSRAPRRVAAREAGDERGDEGISRRGSHET